MKEWVVHDENKGIDISQSCRVLEATVRSVDFI